MWFWGGGGVQIFLDRLLIFSTGSAISKPPYFFQLQHFFLNQQKKKRGGGKKGFSMCYEKIFHMQQYFADFHFNRNARPLQTYTISMQTLIWCLELVHVLFFFY